ncbi:MAG: nucleotidyltransferase domain-containing protein [bacterium]|nr:nucleotidyltransferase domain-containing protein [bacterium]
MNNVEIHKKAREVFEKYPVDLAYLFGSQVTGAVHRTSDVDIAVLFDVALSKEERFEFRLALMGELARALGIQTDVVVINDTASLFFKYVIIKEGQNMYERTPDLRVDFESRAMSLYFDFAPFLEEYNRAYVQRNI